MGKVIQLGVFIVIVVSVLLSVNAKRWVNNFYSPEILFEVTKYDFDTLSKNDSSYYYFKYKNIGNGELKIYNIKTSCGCTIPYWNESYVWFNSSDLDHLLPVFGLNFKIDYSCKTVS